jgi:hypothetical protein
VAGEDGFCHGLGLALAAVGLDHPFQGWASSMPNMDGTFFPP